MVPYDACRASCPTTARPRPCGHPPPPPPIDTTPITDANIYAAVAECEAEDPACQTGPCAFDCPNSQATYGRIADWDVGAVTLFNNWENGCTQDDESWCGGASPPLISWP